MSPYYSSGSYTSESREVAVSETWDAWGNPQASSNVEIVNGAIQLAEEPSQVGIPNSAIAHYDAQSLSLTDGDTVSTWPDETTNGYDLSGASPVYQTGNINGNPAVRFDGNTGPLMSDISDVTQPNTILLVLSAEDVSSVLVALDGNPNADSATQHDLQVNGSDWRLQGDLSGGSRTNDHTLLTCIFDGVNSVIRQDGQQVASGTIASETLAAINLGSRSDGNNAVTGDYGEVLVCDTRLSSTVIDEQEQRMSGRWGLGNFSGVVLSSTTIDDTTPADGVGVADMTGDGNLDVVIGAAHDGGVYWYEQNTPTDWTRHTIATGYNEVEGIGVIDVDGDGNNEVFIADQGAGIIDIAKPDTNDATGSWSTATVVSSAPMCNHTRHFDLDGDGTPEFVFGYEGTTTGEGGLEWLEYTGGGVLTASNWTRHVIAQEAGTWGISRSRSDVSGDGHAEDIVFTVWSERVSGADGGVYTAEFPSSGDPTDSWTVTRLTTTSSIHVDTGDFTGDGTPTDIVVSYSYDVSGRGIDILEDDGSWTRSEVTASGPYYNVRAATYSGGADDLIAVTRDSSADGTLQYWMTDSGISGYGINESQSLYKEVETLPFADIDGDGEDEFVTVSEEQWIEYWDVEVGS